MTFRNSQTLIVVFLYLSASTISISHAEKLYITDDYLQGLNDEISSPEYLEEAKKELQETERLEQSQTINSAEIQKASVSMYNFEDLLRKKHSSSHSVYSKLPTSSRIIIFDRFKKTKKLSAAKRMIIEKYEAK